jgi:hypothetical protein
MNYIWMRLVLLYSRTSNKKRDVARGTPQKWEYLTFVSASSTQPQSRSNSFSSTHPHTHPIVLFLPAPNICLSLAIYDRSTRKLCKYIASTLVTWRGSSRWNNLVISQRTMNLVLDRRPLKRKALTLPLFAIERPVIDVEHFFKLRQTNAMCLARRPKIHHHVCTRTESRLKGQ